MNIISSVSPSLTDLLSLPNPDESDDVLFADLQPDDVDSPERISRQLAEGVKRGQLWSAADADGNMMYVLVTAVSNDRRTATVIPLSNDARMETANSLVIEEGSPLDIPMVAWPSLTAIIPVHLLRKPLKEFAPQTVSSIEHNDPALTAPQDSIRRGVDPEDGYSQAFDERDDIAVALIVWHGMCADLPVLGEGSIDETTAQTDNGNLELYNQALHDVLKLKPSMRLAIIRGMIQLTPEQQHEMETAGFASMPSKYEQIPDDYMIMVEQPEWRSVVEKLNPEHPEVARLQLARKAAYGLAARTTGHGESAIRGALNKAADQLLEEKEGRIGR